MLRTASAYIPRYGLYYETLEKYCTPCKPVSRIANPEPNRIDTVTQKLISYIILLGMKRAGKSLKLPAHDLLLPRKYLWFHRSFVDANIVD
jgi:hypothetical protein